MKSKKLDDLIVKVLYSKKFNIGNRSWKMGENPTQGRYCNSLMLQQKPLDDTGKALKTKFLGTQAISQNTCLFSTTRTTLRISGVTNVNVSIPG